MIHFECKTTTLYSSYTEIEILRWNLKINQSENRVKFNELKKNSTSILLIYLEIIKFEFEFIWFMKRSWNTHKQCMQYINTAFMKVYPLSTKVLLDMKIAREFFDSWSQWLGNIMEVLILPWEIYIYRKSDAR